MSDSQSAGGIHYDVSMDIKELLVGEKQVNKVMDNVEKSTDKATSSLNKLDKVASQVGVAMKMPEINKLSRDMAQLSGKIGANSAATEKAAQTHNRFTGVLSTVSGSLGAGYVGNIGNATESLIKHTQAAINATAEEIKNAEAMQKQAQAYQAEASQLVLSTQEKRKAAEEAVTLAESELQVAEALADRKTVSLESLEALKKSQQYQLRQAELNDEMSSNEKTLAEVTKARTAVQRTQNQIDKQSTEIANDVWKAEDKVKAAKENLHNTTIELNKAKGLEAQATATVIAADEASALAKEKATMAAKAQVIAMNGLRSVMALLGGPTGILLLVAAGVYALYQAMSDTDKIDEFNKKIDDSIDKLEELNSAQAKYAADKFGKDLEKKIDKLKEYEKEINHLNNAIKTSERTGFFNDELTEKLTRTKALADETTKQIIILTGAVSRSSEQAKRAVGPTTEQWAAQVALNNETQSLTKQNELLARSLLDGEAAARDTVAINEFREKLEKLGITGETATDAIDAFSSALQFNKDLTLGIAVDKMKEKVEELTIRLNKGEEAAIRFNAQMMIKHSGWDENSDDAKEYIKLSETAAKLTKQISDGKKKGRTGTKKDKAEEGLKRQQNEVEALKKRYELLSNGVEDVNKEMAAFEAAQKLGSKATDKQKEAASKEAEEIYNLTQKISDFNRAQEATPELKLAREFGEEAKTIRRMFDEGFIDKETFTRLGREATQAFEQGMSDIRIETTSNNIITDIGENRAKFDPIQALANENTRKLAMMKEYYDQEQQLLTDSYAKQQITHEQYTAAKSATDMQYHMLITAMDKQYQEQQTAAQWELMRNQSTGYEALASAIDSLGGNASNVMTGLLTKTMDMSDAARSLGNTILNSVLNSYVQLGVEMLKNFVLSKTLGVASQAANAAAAAAGGTAALAAWTPAAIAASIATGGAASATGLGAFKTSMLSGQAMSMVGLAGARYNGGPVNAGEMYRVGEHGKPEIYRASSGKQYMIPGDNGRVISNKDMQGSGKGITLNIEFNDYSSGKHQFEAQASQNGDTLTVQAFLTDMQEKGPMHRSITQNTTATTRL
ncbi:hypothetical protein QDQ39_20390 [Providencia rettgeri]|uniref:hypothetical protein n=1 Tax=Providencia rettgeri TaxID=587 RepID=UPI0024499033|nr:hypothetical protein [Providencia rettgeri]MDH2398168.1 hypothetical protein [Providencia rettgeri]